MFENQRGEARDLYLCVSVCVRIITTVFRVTVLSGSYLPYPSIQSASHRETVFWKDVYGSHPFRKGKLDEKQTHGCVDFLKIEVVHSILFTINLIFKHYLDLTGGLMKVLHFYILKSIVVFF